MEETLIPQIKEYYINLKWRNLKGGYFEFQEWKTTPNIKLYFHEFEYWTMDDGKECQSDTYSTEQWKINKENHIVAIGFIAFYLYWIQSRCKDNSLIDLFDTYFVHLRNIFIAEKKTQLEYIEYIKTIGEESTNMFYQDMFYQQHIIDEGNRIENSQGLFEYLTIQDKKEIQRYIDAYFEYIKKYNSTIQQYRIEFDKDTENNVLEIYKFWNSTGKNRNANTPIIQNNIFKNTNQSEFLEMVSHADFSKLYNTKTLKQRVGQTVVELSNIINDEKWTERATKTLNTTIRKLQKNTSFSEYEALKNKFMR